MASLPLEVKNPGAAEGMVSVTLLLWVPPFMTVNVTACPGADVDGHLSIHLVIAHVQQRRWRTVYEYLCFAKRIWKRHRSCGRGLSG